MILSLEIILAGFLTGAVIAALWTAAEYVHVKREFSREIDAEYFLLCMSDGSGGQIS